MIHSDRFPLLCMRPSPCDRGALALVSHTGRQGVGGSDWIGLDWTGLDWIGLNCFGCFVLFC